MIIEEVGVRWNSANSSNVKAKDVLDAVRKKTGIQNVTIARRCEGEEILCWPGDSLGAGKQRILRDFMKEIFKVDVVNVFRKTEEYEFMLTSDRLREVGEICARRMRRPVICD